MMKLWHCICYITNTAVFCLIKDADSMDTYALIPLAHLAYRFDFCPSLFSHLRFIISLFSSRLPSAGAF